MLRIYNHYISRHALLLVSFDWLLLMVAFYCASSINLLFGDQTLTFSSVLYIQVVIFSLVMISSIAAVGMYQTDAKQDLKGTLYRLAPAMILGFVLLTLVFYLFPEIYLGSEVLIVAILLSFAGIFLGRIIFFRWSQLGILQPRVLVLGTGSRANELIAHTEDSVGHHRIKIIGFVPFYGEERCVPSANILPVESTLATLIKKHSASEIIVATQDRRGGGFPIQELLECRMNGIKVMDISTFFEREEGRIRMDSLPSWLVFGVGFDQSIVRSAIKRIFDLVASILLLVIMVPVMLFAALLILIEDGFPIFYRQERVGKNGKVFIVLKFRSMTNHAEKDKKPQWAAKDDPRVTSIGKFMRKLRIDELPQIANVLKNEMSFVGPRPERPYFVDMLCAKVPYYNLRHSVKPGITGWSQVRYPYGSSVEDAIEKLQYDLYYVKNHSLFLDIVILINTIEVVLFSKGGR